MLLGETVVPEGNRRLEKSRRLFDSLKMSKIYFINLLLCEV